MEWGLAIIAGVIVASGLGEPALGFVLGGAVGWLIGRLIELEGRLRRLESGKHVPEKQLSEKPTRQPAGQDSPTASRPVMPRRSPYEQQLSATVNKSPESPSPGPAPHSAAARTGSPGYDWRNHPIIRWLLSGNVPVKVGVLVSFFGVAFLLKYAVDEGWMSFPVELRLFGVAVFGVVLLGLGWRLRNGHRVYALSIQGGGIGILYLTAYSALRLFDVMPASISFGAMVLIAAGAAWLAIRQDARALAVLGSVGGFLAPLLASTGTGSHVALFSYYLLLNIGIAAVAWFRHWRMLNLLGFMFTFAIGLVWGAQYYREEYFASVEPFLVAHFMLYTAIAILSALKQPFRLRGYVDSALVFGLPLIAFPLQAALVDGDTRSLAWSATVLAGFYALLAHGIARHWGETLRLLSQVYVALAVIFATLAVPLWLDAPWVSNTWALEAAAMIGIGLKQRRELTHWAGVLLLAGATLVFMASAPGLGTESLLLNERFLGGLVLCISYSFCAWIYPLHGKEIIREMPLHWFAVVFAWAGWLLLAHIEIQEQVAAHIEPVINLLVLVGITVLLERLATRWVVHARALAASLLPLLVVHLFWWSDEYSHFLTAWGLLAWPAAVAALIWLLECLPTQRRWLLVGSAWFGAAWLFIEIDYLVNQLHGGIGSDWNHAAELLMLPIWIAGLSQLMRWRYADEVAERFALMPLILLATFYLLFWNIATPGQFAPLPFLAVLNPQMLLGGLLVVLLHRYGRRLYAELPWNRVIAGMGFYLVTMEIARNAHHVGGVAFNMESLWHSGVFQAALSVVWSVLGIAAMLLGARTLRRGLWMTGTGLMAIVVIKLFLVDLGNTGSLTRVISFIVVGLLLLVVGYFAPAPAMHKHRTGEAG